MAVPGSMAYLYADGVALLFQGDPTLYKAIAAPTPGGGWDIGGGIILSDFVVTPDGLIQTFSRNGISVDKLIAPGDGTTYTATPTTDQNKWSGQLQARIHSFRFLDGHLQILVTNENQRQPKAALPSRPTPSPASNTQEHAATPHHQEPPRQVFRNSRT